jgi:hypothetical protein
MGEILGLGMTHWPGLSPYKTRPSSLKRALQDPGLPEHLRQPSGWPERLRQEWADDEGSRVGEAHRERVVAEIREARRLLDDFQPDFVVVWGDDQYENFKEDLVPPFCVMAYDQIEAKPWSHFTEPNFWGEPPETTFHLSGHRGGAKFLASSLLGDSFDVAYAYKPLHHDLGHAFINTVMYLDWDRRGFDHPLVPFSVNCLGRLTISWHGYMRSLADTRPDEELDPPSPSPARCFDLGAACARALSASPYRVALIASASWSHAFLTRKHHYLYPDLEADRKLFDALVRGDYQYWRDMPLQAVEDSGEHEMLNWFCLAGAMAELGRKPATAVLVDTYVMVSSKVIATFPPEKVASPLTSG